MNEGKKFEQDFKNSIPSKCWYYRFKDGTANFDGAKEEDSDEYKNKNVRFQAKNICDCMVFHAGFLYLLELKSTKSKSLPFSMIRDNQIKELTKADDFNKIIPGFIINFRAVSETYFMNIRQFNEFVETTDRKSIPLDFFRIECTLVPQELRRVRTRYLLDYFFD